MAGVEVASLQALVAHYQDTRETLACALGWLISPAAAATSKKAQFPGARLYDNPASLFGSPE